MFYQQVSSFASASLSRFTSLFHCSPDPDFHMKQVEDATKADAEQYFTKALATRQRESPRVGQLLLLYVDEALTMPCPDARRSPSSRRRRC
jgi:hypothetical protein